CGLGSKRAWLKNRLPTPARRSSLLFSVLICCLAILLKPSSLQLHTTLLKRECVCSIRSVSCWPVPPRMLKKPSHISHPLRLKTNTMASARRHIAEEHKIQKFASSPVRWTRSAAPFQNFHLRCAPFLSR